MSETTETVAQVAPISGESAITDTAIIDTAITSPASDVQPSTEASADESQLIPAHAHQHQHAPAMNPELVREITVEAPAEEVSRAFDQVTKRYRRLAQIPGFRAGKVPDAVVRRKFAKELRQEVLESLVARRFQTELEQQNLNPVSEPQLRDLMLADGQPLRFTAQFEIQPEINLAGYESIPVSKPDTALSEAEYQAELARVLDGYATVETVEEDRPLADGDWAEIQFTGKMQEPAQVEGEAASAEPIEQEPISGEDVLLEIGGANTLPAFNDALRGTKPGQELSFEVEYPQDFGEPRLAGRTVSYDVTVKAIKKKTLPERDADFAAKLGNYSSFEEFETKLREMAAQRKQDALESRAKDDMLEAMIARFPFPVPEIFVQQQIEARLERGLRALAQQGMTSEQMRQLDFHRLRDAQRDQAVNEVKASMILDKLAGLEAISVSDEELDRELLTLSLQSREPLDTLRERLTRDGQLDRIREQIRRERTGTAVYNKLAA